MAAPPSSHRITREDLREAPAWIDRLLRVLNDFMRDVYNALKGTLTIGENVRGEFRTTRVLAGANPEDNTFAFLTTVPKPRYVGVGQVSQVDDPYSPITAAVYASWRFEDGQVIVNAITGLTNGEVYDITVLVL
jgi:hypothetical protein